MLMVQNKSLLVQNKKKPMLRLRVSVCIGKQQTHFGLKLLRLSVMDHFRNYLNFTKDALEKNTFNKIHIVLGNESCDLDSCISSLAIAYHLYNNRIPTISANTLVVPIQNVSAEHFLFRSDNCFVLKEAGIPLNLLIYRDNIDFKSLLKEKTVTTTLVDHHILSDADRILEPTVVQIIDHRPIDAAIKWNANEVDMKIEQVGSCSTLVAEKILQTNKQNLFRELAYLIYETIIYDTIGLLPEHGKAKELDIKVANEIAKLYDFNEDKKMIYEKLWKAHNDVSHLTPRQLLYKDLKIVENIPVPGLPMLVADFLKLENAYQAIENFIKEHNASLVLLIGLDATADVKRDVAIFFTEDSKTLKENLLKNLKNSEELKGYNFSFSEVPTIYDNIVCLRQHNIKLSRKQIIPILKDCLLEK